MTRIAHIQKRRDAARVAQERIIRLLEWSELQYCDFQYSTGLAYLEAYIPSDPDGIDMLERSHIFWNWWKNHWTLRDETYLASNISTVSLRYRRNIYTELHNPRALALGITPPAVVLEESYAVMIQETFKEPSI